jgi:hypothetical protein
MSKLPILKLVPGLEPNDGQLFDLNVTVPMFANNEFQSLFLPFEAAGSKSAVNLISPPALKKCLRASAVANVTVTIWSRTPAHALVDELFVLFAVIVLCEVSAV